MNKDKLKLLNEILEFINIRIDVLTTIKIKWTTDPYQKEVDGSIIILEDLKKEIIHKYNLEENNE